MDSRPKGCGAVAAVTARSGQGPGSEGLAPGGQSRRVGEAGLCPREQAARVQGQRLEGVLGEGAPGGGT